jgi:hypothetical protein
MTGLPSFPTLTLGVDYEIERDQEDSVLRSEMEAGYVMTRQRYTRVRQKWGVTISMMTDADATALLTFLNVTVAGGAGGFTWYCKLDKTTYNVRFQKPFKITNVAGETADTYYYKTERFILEQM